MTKIRCLKCGDVLVGDKKGTYIQCSCGNVYIDETEYYCRVGFKDENQYKLLKGFKYPLLVRIKREIRKRKQKKFLKKFKKWSNRK